jgi:hypothetical protein
MIETKLNHIFVLYFSLYGGCSLFGGFLGKYALWITLLRSILSEALIIVQGELITMRRR